MKKYYAILQRKWKDKLGETHVSEHVYDVESKFRIIAINEINEYASQNDMTVQSIHAYQ